MKLPNELLRLCERNMISDVDIILGADLLGGEMV